MEARQHARPECRAEQTPRNHATRSGVIPERWRRAGWLVAIPPECSPCPASHPAYRRPHTQQKIARTATMIGKAGQPVTVAPRIIDATVYRPHASFRKNWRSRVVVSDWPFTAFRRPLGDRSLALDAGLHHSEREGRDSRRRQRRRILRCVCLGWSRRSYRSSASVALLRRDCDLRRCSSVQLDD